MDYNTQREKLILPEYGRHIQSMVDFAKTREDRDERQACANTIVRLMGKMYDKNNTSEDIQQKLWNHFAAMANYDIDIDYPVTIEKKEDRDEQREFLKYPQRRIHERHYGALVEESARILMTMEEGEEKKEFTRMLANQMKRDLASWNSNAMTDEKVFDDLSDYTQGNSDAQVSSIRLISDADILSSVHTHSKKKKKK